jgi:acyl-CoA synthetase (AMP-forming)/AMP-acid ligase II
MSQAPSLTLASALYANARHYRDRPAWVHGGKTLTHGEFLERTTRLASAWRAWGLRPQDRVAVLSRNALEICEIYAAGELSGIITATVSFRFAAPEISYIVGDSAPRVLVFEAEFAATIDRLRPGLSSVEQYVCLGGGCDWAADYEDVLASGSMEPVPLPRESDVAYLIYTSGTTGRPKGVMLTHAGKTRSTQILNGLSGAGPEDRTLLMMPMFHIGAKDIQLSQHWRGGAVYLHREFDAEAILRSIQDDRITITHMAPTMIQMLLDHPRIGDFDLSSLRLIIYSAAAMPVALLRRGLDLLGPVFMQMYGQTEGSGTVLTIEDHRPEGDERDVRRLQSIGTVFPGIQLRIADDDGSDCAVDQPGEILLAGATLMAGYWNNSVATVETLRDGWLHTGDVGKLDEDGYVYLVDRKKDMIVSGGENIYSREVEEALYQHQAIANAAVIAVPDEKWGEAVRGVVELRGSATVSEADLIAHCRTLIAGYKCPKSIVFVDELPKLASGKINKLEIRKTHGMAR